MTQKKSAKKKAKKVGKRPPLSPNRKLYQDGEKAGFRILAMIEMSDGVEEILVSNEAKLYLTGIQRGRAKLQAMLDRELALRHHPGHPDHAKT